MNFYAILGIPPDADDTTIRTAYRALARRYHPDAGEGSSTEKFREIVAAYETLSDPRRRQIHDVALGYTRPVRVPVEPISEFVEPLRGPHTVLSRSSFLGPSFDEVFDELLRWLDMYLG